jgi:hypothetical protein
MSKLEETLKMTSKAKPETVAKFKRIPLGADRDILWVDGMDSNKRYAWINDYNVASMQASGFEFVPTGAVRVSDHNRYGSQIGDVVSKGVGAGVVAYLMCIDKELYEQDMKAIAAKTDAQESGIYREAKSGGLEGSLKFGRGKSNLE